MLLFQVFVSVLLLVLGLSVRDAEGTIADQEDQEDQEDQVDQEDQEDQVDHGQEECIQRKKNSCLEKCDKDTEKCEVGCRSAQDCVESCKVDYKACAVECYDAAKLSCIPAQDDPTTTPAPIN